KRHCSSFATRPGAGGHSGPQTRGKPENACAPPCFRKTDVCRGRAETQVRSCQATSRRRLIVDFGDSLAPRLSGRQRVHPCVQTLDRRSSEESPTAIELRIVPSLVLQVDAAHAQCGRSARRRWCRTSKQPQTTLKTQQPLPTVE